MSAGVPASALSRVETGCAWARQLVLDLAASLWVLVCRCQCPQWQWQQPGEDSETVEVGSRTSSRSSLWWHNGYSQIPSQDGDVEIGRQETAIRPTAAGTGTAGGSRVSPVVQSPTSGPYSSSSSSNTLSLSKGPLKPEAATTMYV